MNDVRFTTESGAQYEIVNNRVRRVGPFSPGIDYENAPDGRWLDLKQATRVVVGLPVHMSLANGKWRLTTPVTSVVEL